MITNRHDNLLLALVNALDVDYKVERSFKLSYKRLLEKRYLIIIEKSNIKQDLQKKLSHICKRIEMPADFLESFFDYLPDAGCIDFGFQANEKTCVYKAYLDLSVKKEKEIKTGSIQADPFVVFLGFKWDPLDHTRRALTRYIWHPSISFEKIHRKISNVYQHSTYKEPLEIAKEFINIVSGRVAHDNLIYLDVKDENTRRRSFDINVYSAQIKLKEIYPLLMKIYQHYSIPENKFHAFYNQNRTKTVGHFSGGINREGQDFLTVYYGVEKIEVKTASDS